MTFRSRAFELMPLLAAFAAIYVVWGSTYLAVAVTVKSIPPFALMGIRSILAGTVLLAVALLRREKPSWYDWRLAAASGLLLFVGCHGLMAVAQTRVASGVAAIMLATVPFWIVLCKLILPREKGRPSLATLAALVPGLVGVSLVAWPQETSGTSELPLLLVLLLAAGSWSLGTVLAQRHDGPLSAAGLQLMCGGAALIMLSVLAGEPGQFSPQAVTASAWAGLAYLTLIGSVLAFTAYNWLLDHVEAPLVATYTFVNPVVAVILGWLILGEELSLPMLAGFGLVIASVIGVWALDNPKLKDVVRRTIGKRDRKRRTAKSGT